MRRLTAALALVCFACPGQVSGFSADERLSLQQLLDQPERAIPADLGRAATLPAPVTPTDQAPVVILIEDAHANYEGQRSLAAILQRLIAETGLRLVLVEGGTGKLDLPYMRGRASEAARRQAAERQLKEGVLSGEEYLAILSESPPKLWGVEDPALYSVGLASLLEVNAARVQAQPSLRVLQDAASQIMEKRLPASMRRIDAFGAGFKQGAAPLSEYACAVADAAAEARLPVEDFRSLTAYLESAALGRAMSSGAARLQKHERLELSDRYRRISAGVEPRSLWKDLRDCRARVRRTLAEQSGAQALLDGAERLELTVELIETRLSEDDYSLVLAGSETLSRPQLWIDALRQEALAAGVSWPQVRESDGAWIRTALEAAMRFYETADARSVALVDRALAKMAGDHEPAAALIVGGFHTQRLTQLLAARGARVMLVTPRAGQDEEADRYMNVLKKKLGQGQTAPVNDASGDLGEQWVTSLPWLTGMDW